MSDENEEIDWENSELWEHQGSPLTVRWLLMALDGLDPDLPIEAAVLDGGDVVDAEVMHIAREGEGSRPTSVVVTVTVS